MIKINLAATKQSSSQISFGNLPEINFEFLKQIPIMKIALPLLVAFMASHMLEGYKSDELKKIEDAIQKLKTQVGKIQLEINKSKDYEILKRQFDDDERVVRSKLDTIRSLMADRANPPKMLLAVAQVIPEKVWLTELSVDSSSVLMTGSSLGFAPISDFLKSLGEIAYFSDLELNKIRKDEGSSSDINRFELSAKRGKK